MDAFYHQRRQHREQRMDQNYEDDEEHDPDYLLALRLSAELNGPGGPSGIARPRDSKKKVTDMLSVFKGDQTHDKSQTKRKSSGALLLPRATSSSTRELASGTGEKPIREVNYEPETSSACSILNTFSEFTHHIKTRRCNECKEPLFASKVDVLTPFQNWMDGVVDRLSCTVRCKSCAASACIACTPEPFSKLSKSRIRDNKQEVAWCCVSGRLFLIWTLLCGFDSHLSESRKVDKTAKPPKPDTSSSHSNHGKRSMASVLGGVGYGGSRYSQSYLPKGTGYDSVGDDEIDYYDSDFEAEIQDLLKATGYSPGPRKTSEPAQKKESVTKAQRAQMSEDRLGKLILGFLTDLLPSLERETCFDYDPPVAVLEMLTGSKVLNYCAELLRNDSLVDIVRRKDLYQNLFSFLTVLGSHSSTGEALFCVRSVRSEPINLLTLSFCEDLGLKENVPSLADGLRNLTAQSSLVLQNAARNQADFASDDGLAMLGICRQVSSLAEFIQANNPQHTNSKEKVVDSDIPEELRFASVEEKQILPTYMFASDAMKLDTSQPGRFKRLITEITTLQTGLPPGIFVRYCENRPDILKCVIIGPVGTPYENGMFEFDILCGASFPNEPPQVSFKGTGGGRAAINPNLYPDGKVCLSLLGTWAGERWDPKKSTLLQVLVSIQAMILCAEPWYNEPGREADYNPLTADSPSARYNRIVRMETVRHALLHHWLKETPELWKDVVTHHFTQHGNDILKKAEEWANDAARAAKWPQKRRHPGEFPYQWAYPVTPEARDGEAAFKPAPESLVCKLQEALKKYGATYKINYVPPPPSPPSPPTRPRSDSVSSPLFPPPSAPPLHFSSPWGAQDPQYLTIPGYSNFNSAAEFHQSFHPSPFAPGAGRGGISGAPPGFGAPVVGSGSQATNPPPGPLIASSSGPPSSNTRSAARGRGGGTEASSHRGRGGGVEASSHGGRGGSSQGHLAAFGRGGGAIGFDLSTQPYSEYFSSTTTHGGRGSLGRGRGRGGGRGDRGGRGVH